MTEAACGFWLKKEHPGHLQKMENKGAARASEVTGSPDALRSSCRPDEFGMLFISASVVLGLS